VNPSEELVLCLRGRTPQTGALYSGTFELRTPGQILIGQPMEITVNVYEANEPRAIRACDEEG
jgi:hypothetical protein